MTQVNKWITRTTNVDIETGEVLTDTNEYYKVKTIKNVKYEEYGHKTIGFIEWTIQHKRKLKQIEIEFPDDK